MIDAMEVIEPGFLTTVQDLGRPGYAYIGVSAGGAADPFSLRVGNRLVGNRESAAALEITVHGGIFRFERDTVFALAGGDFDARLDGRAVASWRAVRARRGAQLAIGGVRRGARCYLSIDGGFAAEEFLGSASTDLRAGFGRRLRKGDRLCAGEPTGQPLEVDATALKYHVLGSGLRVTRGPQAHMFAADVLETLCRSPYAVRQDSNRLGLRLRGTAIPPTSRDQLLTEGVSLGAVQIPPDGQPIILFVDQQTTGGYLKVANVILADLPRVGQLAPRSQVNFVEVDLAIAQRALLEREAVFNAVLGSCA